MGITTRSIAMFRDICHPHQYLLLLKPIQRGKRTMRPNLSLNPDCLRQPVSFAVRPHTKQTTSCNQPSSKTAVHPLQVLEKSELFTLATKDFKKLKYFEASRDKRSQLSFIARMATGNSCCASVSH